MSEFADSKNKRVATWLLICCALVFVMVVLGGGVFAERYRHLLLIAPPGAVRIQFLDDFGSKSNSESI